MHEESEGRDGDKMRQHMVGTGDGTLLKKVWNEDVVEMTSFDLAGGIKFFSVVDERRTGDQGIVTVIADRLPEFIKKRKVHN